MQMEQLNELEPYLAGLNVSEALEDFGRLADLVLSRRPAQPSATKSISNEGCYSPEEGPANSRAPSSGHYASYGVPSSPEGDTFRHYPANLTPASSQWLSQPPSPSFSYSGSSGFSCYSSSSSFSSSSSSSSASNSRPHSRAPSSHDDDDNEPGPLRRRRSGGSSGRKRQNATAAERYRRRLKGRKSGLEEELERERERHSRLLASLESKMLLYREFAHLLAANTRDPTCDSSLAQVGSRSLESVLECVAPLGLLDQSEQGELEHLLAHFKRLSAAATAAAPSAGYERQQYQYY